MERVPCAAGQLGCQERGGEGFAEQPLASPLPALPSRDSLARSTSGVACRFSPFIYISRRKGGSGVGGRNLFRKGGGAAARPVSSGPPLPLPRRRPREITVSQAVSVAQTERQRGGRRLARGVGWGVWRRRRRRQGHRWRCSGKGLSELLRLSRAVPRWRLVQLLRAHFPQLLLPAATRRRTGGREGQQCAATMRPPTPQSLSEPTAEEPFRFRFVGFGLVSSSS